MSDRELLELAQHNCRALEMDLANHAGSKVWRNATELCLKKNQAIVRAAAELGRTK